VLCTGLTLRHVTPERELHSNLRLLCVNLLKTERLRENPLYAGFCPATAG
jgi:hypothetical protein